MSALFAELLVRIFRSYMVFGALVKSRYKFILSIYNQLYFALMGLLMFKFDKLCH